MRIAALFLADAATVREGLANVLGAGVNVMFRSSFPAPMGVTLVIMAEHEPGVDDTNSSGAFSVDIRAADDPENSLAQIEGAWGRHEDSAPDDPRVTNYTTIAIPLDQVGMNHPGYYELELDMKGIETRKIRFRAVEVPAPKLPPI